MRRSVEARQCSLVDAGAHTSRCSAHHACILSACALARLPIRSCTTRSQRCDERKAVTVVPARYVIHAFVERLREASTLVRVEVIVDGNELDLGAFGKLGRLSGAMASCYRASHHPAS